MATHPTLAAAMLREQLEGKNDAWFLEQLTEGVGFDKSIKPGDKESQASVNMVMKHLVRPLCVKWKADQFYLGQFCLGQFHSGQSTLGQCYFGQVRPGPINF